MTMYPVWAEVDLGAIEANIGAIRKKIRPGTLIMAVVKANAYGHGVIEIANTALACGVNYLGVARAGEGVRLREAGITAPILILGYTYPKEAWMLARYNLMPTVFSLKDAQLLSELAAGEKTSLAIHIKIDSGMGRLGFWPGQNALRDIESIATLPGLRPEGIYTHFATADEADKSYANMQYEAFMDFLRQLEQKGLEIPLKHAANSAALIDLDCTNLDMVRAGIAMYGYYPSPDVKKCEVQLKPAMELKTRVSQVKKVRAGFKVSYGIIYEAPKDTTLATLTVGYADGYSRQLSNAGEVLVQGERAKIAGRICMDQCVIDIGHLREVRPGDEAVLFGRQGNECISIEEVAAHTGTINYEVLCSISDRVPRVYRR